MKKNLFSAVIIILVAIAVWWFLKKPSQSRNPMPVIPANDVVSSNANATQSTVVTQQPVIMAIQPTNESTVVIETKTNAPELVLAQYKTLEDLKQIKSLQPEGEYPGLKDWVSEGKLVAFQINGRSGKPAIFNADFVAALTDANDEHIHQLDLHSPRMNIDQIREIGLQLDGALGLDSKDFLAWCDKVGNKQFDQPLFSSGGVRVPDSNQYCSFGVYSTSDGENPWYIHFFITDP